MLFLKKETCCLCGYRITDFQLGVENHAGHRYYCSECFHSLSYQVQEDRIGFQTGTPVNLFKAQFIGDEFISNGIYCIYTNTKSLLCECDFFKEFASSKVIGNLILAVKDSKPFEAANNLLNRVNNAGIGFEITSLRDFRIVEHYNNGDYTGLYVEYKDYQFNAYMTELCFIGIGCADPNDNVFVGVMTEKRGDLDCSVLVIKNCTHTDRIACLASIARDV